MKLSGQYSGKYVRRYPKRGQRRSKKKFFTLLISYLLVLGLAVGGTIAFITTQTDEKENTFTPARVSCEVTESFDGTTKSNVAVKNTGNTDAYIRAAINITWMKDADAADQTVTARTPQQDVDYTIAYPSDSGWLKGADGYWYYPSPIAPNGATGKLIESCTQLANANAPAGYHLSVEIIASAIQSAPETVASAEWKVTIADGKIIGAGGNEVAGE